MHEPKTLQTVFGLPDIPDDLQTIDESRAPSAPPAPVDPQLVTDTATAPRYGMRSMLGRGGMGEVRLCKDARIGREVAIKVARLRRDGQDAVRARFLREARVQGQLEHPAIVPVYDLEILDDGSAYFAMKRVRGETLAAVIAALRKGDDDVARRFTLRKLLSAFCSVCLAVDFAHEKGVLHRDIKPGNIMLGDFGEVYLLDWGLAKVVGHDDPKSIDTATPGEDALATVDGSVLGTPGYMAPEQIDSDAGVVGPPTDVYALGAVLFEILARRRYIQANDVIESTLATLKGADPRPSHAARDTAAGEALDDVCARALALAPKDRYPTARALHDAVDAWLAGEQDLERRRAALRRHLDDAAARPDTLAGRAEALRDLGSALALDPENAAARRELVRLLTKTPDELPDAVRARVREDEDARKRQVARLRALSAVAFVPFLPVVLLLGVREPISCAIFFGGIFTSGLLNASVMRAHSKRPGREALADIIYLIACIAMARIAGPLVVLPMLLVAVCVEMQMHPNSRRRIGILVGCIAALIVSFGIELSGIVPTSYAVVESGWLVHSRMVTLGTGALWTVFAASVAALITPSFFIGRVRGELVAAQERLHLQAWQLEQIVPPEAA